MGASAAREVERLDVSRPRPAKAELSATRSAKADLSVNRSQSRVGRLIGEAMRRAEGGQKGAAITLDRDEAQLSRELLSGLFRVRDLDALSDAMLGELGAVLTSEFGTARLDPRERARQLLPHLVEAILEATK